MVKVSKAVLLEQFTFEVAGGETSVHHEYSHAVHIICPFALGSQRVEVWDFP